MTFRYNIKINKRDDSKIEVFVINKAWLAIANEVDSMKIQKKITHLKIECTSFMRPMIKLILSIT